MLSHDYIKSEVTLHLVDVSKGIYIFPCTPTISAYNTLLLHALEKVMGINSLDEVNKLLNKRVKLGQSTLYVVSYLERASNRLDETVLTMLCNAFLAGLPEENLLSPNALVSQA